MSLREWIRILAILAFAWFVFLMVRRREVKRGVWSIVGVVLIVLFGVFVVVYGKLWHAWIFPVRIDTKPAH